MIFIYNIVFALAVCFYFCAAGNYLYQVMTKSDRFTTARQFFFIAGLVLHSVLIGLFEQVNSETPLGAIGILMLCSWVIAAAYGTFELFSKSHKLGAVAAGVSLLVLCTAWFLGFTFTDPVSHNALTVYQEWPILAVHVGAFMAAALCFAVSGIASITFLYQSGRLKRHKTKALRSRVPSISSLKLIADRAVIIGLPIMTIGLLLGINHGLYNGALADFSGEGFPFASVRILVSSFLWSWYIIYLLTVHIMKASTRVSAWFSIVGMVGILTLTVLSATLPMLNG